MIITSESKAPEIRRRPVATLSALVLAAVMAIGIAGPALAETNLALQGWEASATRSTPGNGLHGWEASARAPQAGLASTVGLQGWEVAEQTPQAGLASTVGLQGWEVAEQTPQAGLASTVGLQGWEVAQSYGTTTADRQRAGSVEAPAAGARASFDKVAIAGLLSIGLLLGIAGTLAVGRITRLRHV